MEKSLMSFLDKIEDFRQKSGRRHPLKPTLVIIIMGIMSGRSSLRALSRFAKDNQQTFVELFDLPHGVPTFGTIRTILQGIDFEGVTQQFQDWMQTAYPLESQSWLSLDGKALASTVTEEHNQYQNFVSLVSLFAQQTGLVYGVHKMENAKSYEPEIVRQLLQQMGLSQMLIRLDALHCQKNTEPDC